MVNDGKFLTTGVGSLPKPVWLQAQSAMNAGQKDHHGKGADWHLEGEALRLAHAETARAITDGGDGNVDIMSTADRIIIRHRCETRESRGLLPRPPVLMQR